LVDLRLWIPPGIVDCSGRGVSGRADLSLWWSFPDSVCECVCVCVSECYQVQQEPLHLEWLGKKERMKKCGKKGVLYFLELFP